MPKKYVKINLCNKNHLSYILTSDFYFISIQQNAVTNLTIQTIYYYVVLLTIQHLKIGFDAVFRCQEKQKKELVEGAITDAVRYTLLYGG